MNNKAILQYWQDEGIFLKLLNSTTNSTASIPYKKGTIISLGKTNPNTGTLTISKEQSDRIKEKKALGINTNDLIIGITKNIEAILNSNSGLYDKTLFETTLQFNKTLFNVGRIDLDSNTASKLNGEYFNYVITNKYGKTFPKSYPPEIQKYIDTIPIEEVVNVHHNLYYQ